MGSCISYLITQICECAFCMSCQFCAGLLEYELSKAVRFGHSVIVALVFTLAFVLFNYRDTFLASHLLGINYGKSCVNLDNQNQIDQCMLIQSISRASFSLVTLFTALSLISTCSDYVLILFLIFIFIIQ